MRRMENIFLVPISLSLRERSPMRSAFIEVLRVASTRTFPRSRGLGSLRGFRLGVGLRRSGRARRVLVERQERVVHRRHGCSRRESRSKSNVNDAFVARQPTRVRVSTRPRARLLRDANRFLRNSMKKMSRVPYTVSYKLMWKFIFSRTLGAPCNFPSGKAFFQENPTLELILE